MHEKHAQKKPTISEYIHNLAFHRPGHSKETSQQCTSFAYTEAVYHQKVLLGVLHLCLLTLKVTPWRRAAKHLGALTPVHSWSKICGEDDRYDTRLSQCNIRVHWRNSQAKLSRRNNLSRSFFKIFANQPSVFIISFHLPEIPPLPLG